MYVGNYDNSVIKVRHILQNWKASEALYHECAHFWEMLVDNAIGEVGSDEEWKSFLSEHSGGKHMAYSEDVASRLHPQRHRALILSLLESKSDHLVAFGRTDMFGIDVLDPPIEYCTFYFEPSIEAMVILREWIKLWVSEDTSATSMMQICDSGDFSVAE